LTRAQVAQKDPKEYLPFLTQMKALEENYRKYSIEMHLKRYRRALGHLANVHTSVPVVPIASDIRQCGEEHFGACMQLMKQHQLYDETIRIFARQRTSSSFKVGSRSLG
jgi:elongator complex protein 1